MSQNINQTSSETLQAVLPDSSRESFIILFDKNYIKIMIYIYNILKDWELAKDLTQDTFIKALKAIERNQYTEDNKALHWIFQIAHNLTIDYIRKRKRLGFFKPISTGGDFIEQEEHLYFPLLDKEKSPEEQLIESEDGQDIFKLIDRLSQEQKEVLILRIFHDIPFKDIAKHFDVSINTVLGRMRYALINLRKMMFD